MQVDTKDFLDLCESADKKFLFFDLETTGLGADYGDISVCSFKWFGKKAYSLISKDYDTEREFLQDIQQTLESAVLLCGFNSKMFDVPFINTRAILNDLPPLTKKLHLDLYLSVKGKVRIGGKSLGNLGRFFKLREKKLTELHQDTWRLRDYAELRKRGESDVRLTEEMYRKVKPFILQVTR